MKRMIAKKNISRKSLQKYLAKIRVPIWPLGLPIHSAAFVLAIAVLLSVGQQGMTENQSWLPHWDFRRAISIRHEKIDNELTNFPVLVRLNSTNFEFNTACDDGWDVRFTLPGGTLLDCDRDRYDASQQDALYWVRLPVVTATNDTLFYLYYGNPHAAENTNSHGVWTADYVGVWHLNDANGTIHYDSTSNTLHGVVGNAPLDAEGVPGMIGSAVRMIADNYDQYIISPQTTIDTSKGLTFSIWAQPRSAPIGDVLGLPLINIGGANWGPYYTTELNYRSYGAWQESVIAKSGTWAGDVENATTVSVMEKGFTTGVWHHVAATFGYRETESATNTTVRVYLNGEKVKEDIVSGCALRNPMIRPVALGANTHNSYPNSEPRKTFDGMLDEARVAHVARGDAWLRACYQNQKAQDELLDFAALERMPTGLHLIIR